MYRLLNFRALIPLALIVALAMVAACGSDPTEAPTAAPAPTSAPAAAPTEAMSSGSAPAPTAAPAGQRPTNTPVPTPTSIAAQPVTGEALAGGNIRMSAYADAEVWEPVGSGSLSSVQAYSQLYNQIVQFDTTDTTKVVCDLCADWEFSNSGETVTFNLVDNAVWHDGTPLTAADVEFSMARYMNPDVSIGRSGLFRNYTLPVEEGGVKMIDGTTVEFNLSFPSGAFINFLSLDYAKVLPKHVLENPAVENLKQAETVMKYGAMSGPYILEEYSRGQLLPGG